MERQGSVDLHMFADVDDVDKFKNQRCLGCIAYWDAAGWAAVVPVCVCICLCSAIDGDVDGHPREVFGSLDLSVQAQIVILLTDVDVEKVQCVWEGWIRREQLMVDGFMP